MGEERLARWKAASHQQKLAHEQELLEQQEQHEKGKAQQKAEKEHRLKSKEDAGSEDGAREKEAKEADVTEAPVVTTQDAFKWSTVARNERREVDVSFIGGTIYEARKGVEPDPNDRANTPQLVCTCKHPCSKCHPCCLSAFATASSPASSSAPVPSLSLARPCPCSLNTWTKVEEFNRSVW